MAFPNSIAGVKGFYRGYRGFVNPAFPNPGYPNGLTVPSGLPARVVGTADITNAALYGVGGLLDLETLTLALNGGAPVTLTFHAATSSASEAAMLAAIAAAFPGVTAVQGGPLGNKLVLSGPHTIQVVASTSLVNLGLVAGVFSGAAATAHSAMVGGRPVLSVQVP